MRNARIVCLLLVVFLFGTGEFVAAQLPPPSGFATWQEFNAFEARKTQQLIEALRRRELRERPRPPKFKLCPGLQKLEREPGSYQRANLEQLRKAKRYLDKEPWPRFKQGYANWHINKLIVVMPDLLGMVADPQLAKYVWEKGWKALHSYDFKRLCPADQGCYKSALKHIFSSQVRPLAIAAGKEFLQLSPSDQNLIDMMGPITARGYAKKTSVIKDLNSLRVEAARKIIERFEKKASFGEDLSRTEVYYLDRAKQLVQKAESGQLAVELAKEKKEDRVFFIDRLKDMILWVKYGINPFAYEYHYAHEPWYEIYGPGTAYLPPQELIPKKLRWAYAWFPRFAKTVADTTEYWKKISGKTLPGGRRLYCVGGEWRVVVSKEKGIYYVYNSKYSARSPHALVVLGTE